MPCGNRVTLLLDDLPPERAGSKMLYVNTVI